jgi:hypothetical protein
MEASGLFRGYVSISTDTFMAVMVGQKGSVTGINESN